MQVCVKVCIAALHLWHMLVCSLFLWLVTGKTGCCPRASTAYFAALSYAQVPLLAWDIQQILNNDAVYGSAAMKSSSLNGMTQPKVTSQHMC